MPLAKAKIPQSALDAMEAPNAQSLAPYVGSATGLKQLEGFAGQAKAASLKYYQMLGRLNLREQKETAMFKKNLAIVGVEGKDAAAKAAAFKLQTRRKLAEETQADRAKIFGPLLQAKQATALMARDGVNPRNIATNHRATSPERAAIWTMVSQAGPASLATLSRQAVASKDTPEGKLLASALIQRNDEMPKQQRFIQSSELASIVFLEESDATRKQLESISLQAEAIQLIDAAWTSGKPIPPNAKIAFGMEFPDINLTAALEGDDPEESVKAMTSLEKIANNLPGATPQGETSLQEFSRLMKAWDDKQAKEDSKTPEEKQAESDAAWERILKAAEEMDDAA